MRHVRIFEVKFFGPTNTKGARVGIYDLRNNKRCVVLSYNYSTGNIVEQARQWLESKGIECEAVSETFNHKVYLMSDNFETQPER